MQPSGDDVLCPDLVMSRHDEMREHELLRRLRRIVTCYLHQFPLNAVWPKVAEKVELSPARRLRAPIGQVDDGALCHAIDCLVRFVDEAPQTFREPVIALACRRSPFMPCWTTVQCPSSVTMKPCR